MKSLVVKWITNEVNHKDKNSDNEEEEDGDEVTKTESDNEEEVEETETESDNEEEVEETETESIIKYEEGGEAAMAVQNKLNVQALPTRSYLEQTSVPVLLQGLASVNRESPETPIEFLAHFLLKNNPQGSTVAEGQEEEEISDNNVNDDKSRELEDGEIMEFDKVHIGIYILIWLFAAELLLLLDFLIIKC